MKHILTIFLLLLSLSSCTLNKSKTVKTSDGLIEFDFPKEWSVDKEQTQFALQCTSADNSTNTVVFQYNVEDFTKDFTPEDNLAKHIKRLHKGRKNITEIEIYDKVELQNKTLQVSLFTGEKNKRRYYYRIALIEFKDSPVYVISFQSSSYSKWPGNAQILGKILRSAKLSQ